MKTFPINLKLEGMRVLMIGGGAIAHEKLEKLLPHRPRLTLVSPVIRDDVRDLLVAHGHPWIHDVYRREHLAGQQLVIAATGDPELSRQVHADTRESGTLLNAVDIPAYCDFIMPAVVAGEHFSLAICSGGMAAGMSRHVREELEVAVRGEDEILVVLEKVRALFKRKYATVAERREKMWQILRELERIEKDPAGGGATTGEPI